MFFLYVSFLVIVSFDSFSYLVGSKIGQNKNIFLKLVLIKLLKVIIFGSNFFNNMLEHYLINLFFII